MMTPARLHSRLLEAGFSEELVQASMPEWWSIDGEDSSSAQTLIALLLARRLSLDPQSLLDDNVPIGFLHTGPTKFKHLRIGPGSRLDALTAYCQGVARILFAAFPVEGDISVPDALELRRLVLASGRQYVGFGDVLTLCWSLSIPVIHLRLFPARTKGLTAMAVRLGARHAIFVARESGVAAQYMFHIAHELGHISLGHLRETTTIVDTDTNVSESNEEPSPKDDEELASDQFAQELLTGQREFTVTRTSLGTPSPAAGSPRELAERALQVGREMAIDPGHVVMCFGESTGEWPLAQNAAKLIPDQDEKPGTLVNRVFWDQLGNQPLDQSMAFLRAVAAI
jgi:IrrE N-terminal-like domain